MKFKRYELERCRKLYIQCLQKGEIFQRTVIPQGVYITYRLKNDLVKFFLNNLNELCSATTFKNFYKI